MSSEKTLLASIQSAEAKLANAIESKKPAGVVKVYEQSVEFFRKCYAGFMLSNIKNEPMVDEQAVEPPALPDQLEVEPPTRLARMDYQRPRRIDATGGHDFDFLDQSISRHGKK